MAEVWKQVIGHPDYEVSDYGRVRSQKRWPAIIMRTRTDRYGHHRLELDGITRKVHQLVAAAFIPLPTNVNDAQCIRHIDDDKNNNRADNLCWGTHSQNLIDAYRNGRRK